MLPDDVTAVRTGVAIADGAHLAFARVVGRDAHVLLDRVSPRALFVRSGQMLHTLFLDDAAMPVADVYLCCGDDDYTIVAEGMTGAEVARYLEPHRTGLDATVIDLDATHAAVCLEGPFSWELLAELTTPDVIGLPYLSFFTDAGLQCFRGGKTAEFGYDLLVERTRLAELRERILAAGRAFDLREVDRMTIETCMLEAAFFNVRREARPGLTPIELQLQWRTTSGRTFPGSAALASHRATRRSIMVASPQPIELGPLDGEVRGEVLHAALSPTRGDHLGLAMVDLQFAHPGVELGALRTISSPAVNNRSLYVDPQRHSYATRATTKFPALVRPSWS
jgi:glycine cleavage system aminomethyltransferase T